MYVLAVLALTVPPSLAFMFHVLTEFKREQLKKANDEYCKQLADAHSICASMQATFVSLQDRVDTLRAHDAETQQSLNRLLDRQY